MAGFNQTDSTIITLYCCLFKMKQNPEIALLTSAYRKLRDKGKILNLLQLYSLNIPIKLADT